jgi:cold shock CspA family protein
VTGIVKFFDGRRAYGFIDPLIGKPGQVDAVYFHVEGVCAHQDGWRPGIPAGATVSFDLVRGEKGPQAANVRLIRLKGSALPRKTPNPTGGTPA